MGGTVNKVWSGVWHEGLAHETSGEFTLPVVTDGLVFLPARACTLEMFGPLPGCECVPSPERAQLGLLLQ